MEGVFHPDAEFAYTGMAHKASQIFEPELFDGDENAIVDFKYSSDPRLTWWFDHHQSAFLTPEDAEHFRQDHSGKKMYDPSFKSCTLFICTVAKQKWGFDAPDLDQLVYWANIIDGAQYPDAKTAVELGAPAMKLTLVIEGSKGSDMVQKIIGWMRHRTLEEIVAEPDVQKLFDVLYKRHLDSVDIIRSRAHQDNGVVYFDLTGYDSKAITNSFRTIFSRHHLHGLGKPVQLSHQDLGGLESLGSDEPKHNLATHLRALRRRRPPARRRHQLRTRSAREGARRGRGDHRRAEELE